MEDNLIKYIQKGVRKLLIQLPEEFLYEIMPDTFCKEEILNLIKGFMRRI